MVYFYRFVKDLKAFLLKKQTGRIFKRCFFVLLYVLAVRNLNGLSLRAYGPSIYTVLIIQRRPVPSLNNWIFSNQYLVQGLMRSLLKESNQTEQRSTNDCKKTVDIKQFFIKQQSKSWLLQRTVRTRPFVQADLPIYFKTIRNIWR